ncbi:MAG: PilZ domain-containing protein [Candidatus Melainabacteria bacterium]|nr:PilZ domain-containing protein [Candidatus Melainabacteria bacterium]
MFQPGKVLKVKVETSPGEMGFGRATIIERTGTQLLIQVRTSRDPNKVLPKGTKIWFVNDSPRLTFNGMWQSTVIGSQVSKGRQVLVCAAPKLEPASQKRKQHRVSIEVPVTISLDIDGLEKMDFKTVDLCKSGSAIETSRIDSSVAVDVGLELKAVLHTGDGDVTLTAKVLRVDHNWLANKTTLGLEFIALSQQSSEILDKVLVRVGGTPRDSDLDKTSGGAAGREGMTSWAKQVRKTPAIDAVHDPQADSSEDLGIIGEDDIEIADMDEESDVKTEADSAKIDK